MRKLCAFVLVLLAATALAAASADPWEARLPDGRTLRIVQDGGRGGEGHLLQRRQRDGSADAQFGQGGGAAIELGPDNDSPQVLRADPLGRAWIAGASNAEGRSQAIVLRFTSQGNLDTGYARSGRSAAAPAGRQARALELLPLPDGSAWVAGIVFDEAASERAGWWRLDPAGRVDPGFGKDGLWEWPRDSEPVALEVAPDGSVACLIQRGDDPQLYELWVVGAWPASPRPTLRAMARSAAAPPELRWTQGWSLAGGQAQALPPTTGVGDAAPPAAAAPEGGASEAAATRLSDFPGIAPVAPASSAPGESSSGWDGATASWLLGLGAVALAVWWRRRTRPPRVGDRRR